MGSRMYKIDSASRKFFVDMYVPPPVVLACEQQIENKKPLAEILPTNDLHPMQDSETTTRMQKRDFCDIHSAFQFLS